jgi:hypothetical protein
MADQIEPTWMPVPAVGKSWRNPARILKQSWRDNFSC